MTQLHPRSTLFPYTTLFRSDVGQRYEFCKLGLDNPVATCKFSLQRHIPRSWHDIPFPPTSPLIFRTFCSITCIGLNHGFGVLDRSISLGGLDDYTRRI